VGDKEEPKTPAGRYLKVRMEQAGFRRKGDLADAAGVSASTITRLFSVATYRPDVENVRKLATALRVSPDELIAGMAGEEIATAGPRPGHPLAAELARMLGEGSPLSEKSRLVVTVLVDRVLELGRRNQAHGPFLGAVRADPADYEELPRSALDAVPDDDPDPLSAKLDRLTFHARTLNSADLYQLGVLIQTAIEWAASRPGTPEVPGDPADFQRATAAADRAAVEHAKRQPVPPMSGRRRPVEAPK
jgi:transcriptional regulator with XRE-family HTH domain